jgi:hypothetical protein
MLVHVRNSPRLSYTQTKKQPSNGANTAVLWNLQQKNIWLFQNLSQKTHETTIYIRILYQKSENENGYNLFYIALVDENS